MLRELINPLVLGARSFAQITPKEKGIDFKLLFLLLLMILTISQSILEDRKHASFAMISLLGKSDRRTTPLCLSPFPVGSL